MLRALRAGSRVTSELVLVTAGGMFLTNAALTHRRWHHYSVLPALLHSFNKGNNKISLAIFQTCGTMWNMFNKKLILFPLIYLCWCWNYMHSTSPGHGCWEQHNWRSNHLSPPLTLQSAVGSFSFISVSLLSWRHYLCCGELRFNQGLLGNTWDNISTIYGYVSLWNGNIIVIVCGQFSWPWCSTL